MPREDYSTSTVDGAAGHAAHFFGGGRRSKYDDADPDDATDSPPCCVLCDQYEDECRCAHGCAVQTFENVKVHPCRRDHKDGLVCKGDRYKEIVYGGYHMGKQERQSYGWTHSDHRPRWIVHHKVVIGRKGATQ